MLDFIIKRAVRFVFSLFSLLSVIFILFRVAPGDPTSRVITNQMTEEQIKSLRADFGLEAPLYEQYVRYMINVVQGDFGVSFSSQEPVFSLILPRLFNTLIIIVPGITLILLSAYVTGSYLGSKQGTRADTIGSYAQLTTRAVPHFVLGVLLLIIFSYWLGITPVGRIHPYGEPPQGTMEYIIVTAHHAFLPTLVFTVHYASDAFLLMRGKVVEERQNDHIEFLRLKGLEPKKIRKHIRKNSTIPLLSYAPTLILIGTGGIILIEVVFTWPGIGELLVRSITNRDYPTAQAAFFFIGALVITANFLADILYGVFDPRIKRSD